MDCKPSSSVDVVQLAQHLSQTLSRSFTSARLIDRGSYATVYQLIEASSSYASTSSSSSSKKIQPAVVVRVSSRPVYNDVAIDEERLKIRTFVATLNLIHDSAPKQIRRNVPRILAYDASDTAKFGLGWVAMTRLSGSTLADCWADFGLEEKKRVVEDLAAFIRKLSRSTSRDHIGSVAASEPKGSKGPIPSQWTPLSLARRKGANNLRPIHFTRECQHSSTWSYLREVVESEIAFLRQHQKAAVRCFNMNMVRLRQCGMEDEIPVDVSFASTTTGVYRKQLRALADLARTVIDDNDEDEERFVLAHLHLSPDNILVDPDSGSLTGIIDWEFAGFVPEWVALAPPTWISDEWLPLWNADAGWTMENGDLCEEVETMTRLREIWERTVAWDMQSAAECGFVLKRKMWKACLSEWHELERASAWARGVIGSRHRAGFTHRSQPLLDLPCSESDDSYLDSDFAARCNSPCTADSSTGPFTPIDAVPTLDLPPWTTAHGTKTKTLGLALYESCFVSQMYVQDAPEDGESDDGSGYGDDDEGIVDDTAFEEFALSFAPAPLPHNSSLMVKVTQASPVMPSFVDLSSPIRVPRKMSSKSTNSILEDTEFVRSMNSSVPPSRMASSSIWCAFWEAPRVDVARDLDFVVERDLDAGW